MTVELLEQDEIFFQEFIHDFMNTDENLNDSLYITNIADPIFSNYSLNTPLEPSIELPEAFSEENSTWSPHSTHKRSLDNLSEDERVLSLNNHSYHRINIPPEPSFNDFISEFAACFNQGNISSLAMAMEKYMDKTCMIKISKPGHELVNNGPSFVIRLYQALINAPPDAVMTVHKTSTIHDHGNIIVKTNLRFRGTRLYKDYMDGLKNSDEEFDQNHSLMNFFDKKKMSEEEIARFEQLEKDMNAKGEVPMMFVKISCTMVFDEFTQRMKMYTTSARLSSFRPVNPREM